MDCLAEQNRDNSSWKHGLGVGPLVKFEMYGGFEKLRTAYTITVLSDWSILACHQNGSKVVVAPLANFNAAQHLAGCISNYWKTGKNNR